MTDQAPIPILLTAIGGGGHGEQILKALRLAEAGRYKLFGADANKHCPQFGLVEDAYVIPMARDPEYLDILLELCKKLGARALFHGCEPELEIFSRERERIEKAGIFLPVNPLPVIETCMNKIQTAHFLQSKGFDVPQFVAITDMDALHQVDFFPAVLKPAVGSGGSANCYIVQDRFELEALAVLLHLDESHQSFIVQEYVGTPDEEYTVGILHDMNGAFINSIALRRLLSSQISIKLSVPNRTSRKDLGQNLVISSGVSQGYVDRFPEVTEVCEDVALALGACGPLNIQCRVVNGKVWVFEINPRFSGTTSIRAMMGFNEPEILLRRHVLDESIQPRFSYDSGWVLRSLTESRVF